MTYTKPNYYKNENGKDLIEIYKENFTHEAYRGFMLGNIIKYITRYENKNGIEDLQKASEYIDRLISDSNKEKEDKEVKEDKDTNLGHYHDGGFYVFDEDDVQKALKDNQPNNLRVVDLLNALVDGEKDKQAEKHAEVDNLESLKNAILKLNSIVNDYTIF